MAETNLVLVPAAQLQIQELIALTQNLYLRGRTQRIEIGRSLNQLHALLAKPGFGSYQDALKQIGIPYTTAADYRREAQREDDLDEMREDVTNDGAPDAEDSADSPGPQKNVAASKRTRDRVTRRDFNWKFREVTEAQSAALKRAKKVLTAEEATRVLTIAAHLGTTDLKTLVNDFYKTLSLEATSEAAAA